MRDAPMVRSPRLAHWGEWISGELDERGIGNTEFARRVNAVGATYDHVAVGRWRSGIQGVTPKGCRYIAAALAIPYSTVLRHAGHDMVADAVEARIIDEPPVAINPAPSIVEKISASGLPAAQQRDIESEYNRQIAFLEEAIEAKIARLRGQLGSGEDILAKTADHASDKGKMA